VDDGLHTVALLAVIRLAQESEHTVPSGNTHILSETSRSNFHTLVPPTAVKGYTPEVVTTFKYTEVPRVADEALTSRMLAPPYRAKAEPDLTYKSLSTGEDVTERVFCEESLTTRADTHPPLPTYN
jgi:hypothetical protein